jgi:hypothetical protein
MSITNILGAHAPPDQIGHQFDDLTPNVWQLRPRSQEPPIQAVVGTFPRSPPPVSGIFSTSPSGREIHDMLRQMSAE